MNEKHFVKKLPLVKTQAGGLKLYNLEGASKCA